MEERPVIKLEWTFIDRILEITGWVAMVGIWILTIVNYPGLPDTIPTHFNALGQVDGYGGKGTLLILPLIVTLVVVGLTILNRFPAIFNFPVKITHENAQKQYTNATRFIRYLKLVIALIFGFIAFNAVQNAQGKAEGLGIWVLPLMLGLIFIPLIIYIGWSFKNK